MKKTGWQTMVSVVTLASGLALVACQSPTSSSSNTSSSNNSNSSTSNTSNSSTTVTAPTTLFSDSSLTFNTSPTTQVIQVSDMGGGGSATISTTVPATGTFQSYPQYWDGGIGWAMKPTGTNGYFDLSSVKTITFKIKSATILPTQLALFLQWKSGTSGHGNEFTIPLKSGLTDGSGAATDLGVTDISSWTQVSFTLANLPDTGTTASKLYTGEPTRYGYTAEPFFSANSGDGSSHVDTPFAIKWYGSAGTQTNSGPLSAGASYQIGDIQFLDANGNNVAIASGISWPVLTNPTTVAATPTLASSSVIPFLNSSGTYTNTLMTDWQASWSSNASMADDTKSVSGKTLKKLSFTDPNGYDGADVNGTVSITGKTTLHLDYWTPDGTALAIKVVDFGADGAYGGGDDKEFQVALTSVTKSQWTSVDLDFSALATTGHVAQFVFVGNGGATNQNFWIDNLYFH